MKFHSKYSLTDGWHSAELSDVWWLISDQQREEMDDAHEHCELRGNELIDTLLDVRMCLVCMKTGEWIGTYELDVNNYAYIHAKCPNCGYNHVNRMGKRSTKK